MMGGLRATGAFQENTRIQAGEDARLLSWVWYSVFSLTTWLTKPMSPLLNKQYQPGKKKKEMELKTTLTNCS